MNFKYQDGYYFKSSISMPSPEGPDTLFLGALGSKTISIMALGAGFQIRYWDPLGSGLSSNTMRILGFYMYIHIPAPPPNVAILRALWSL